MLRTSQLAKCLHVQIMSQPCSSVSLKPWNQITKLLQLQRAGVTPVHVLSNLVVIVVPKVLEERVYEAGMRHHCNLLFRSFHQPFCKPNAPLLRGNPGACEVRVQVAGSCLWVLSCEPLRQSYEYTIEASHAQSDMTPEGMPQAQHANRQQIDVAGMHKRISQRTRCLVVTLTLMAFISSRSFAFQRMSSSLSIRLKSTPGNCCLISEIGLLHTGTTSAAYAIHRENCVHPRNSVNLSAGHVHLYRNSQIWQLPI